MTAPAHATDRSGARAARIGPNAAIQLAEALRAFHGEETARAVFASAGLEPWLDAPPDAMIDEREAARLHREVAAALPVAEAQAVAVEAGRRTGAYILAHRIPSMAHVLLKALPNALALPLLLTAIGAHAWTFAGSGAFSVAGRRIRIARNPLAVVSSEGGPGCAWHAAVFETLLRTLVSRRIVVSETRCCAVGDAACTFEIRLVSPRREGPTGAWEARGSGS